MDPAVRAHAQRFADRLLHDIGPERDDDDLVGAALFLVLNGDLGGVAVEVVHVVLEPALVDGLAVPRDLEARLHVGDPLDAHGNLHSFTLLYQLRRSSGTADARIRGRSANTTNRSVTRRTPFPTSPLPCVQRLGGNDPARNAERFVKFERFRLIRVPAIRAAS